MLAQTEHRFSVADYYKMAEAGVLRPDARVELLEGRIVDMSPIGPMHGGILILLTEHFTSAIRRERWSISVQGALRVDDFSEPQPDLLILKPGPDNYRRRHPTPEDVLLLIEVSDSSLAQDRSIKLPIYGRAGVLEVWIINLVEEVIEVYREPNFSGYSSRTVLEIADTAVPEACPDAGIKLSELFLR